jgi:3-methyladenine DNA glycosylase AlkD
MTKENLVKELEKHKNQKGIENWKKFNQKWISYGIGLTQLRAIAKDIPNDHQLSLQCWDTSIYDLKIISILIEEPLKVTRQQIESQIQESEFWMLSNVYNTDLLGKVPFAVELIIDWVAHPNHIKRRAAYSILGVAAKTNKSLKDIFFKNYLYIIQNDIKKEENFVKDAMNNALYLIGQRNFALYKKSLEIAKKIGKVEVDYGDNSCEAIDCLKHLSNEKILKKVTANLI